MDSSQTDMQGTNTRDVSNTGSWYQGWTETLCSIGMWCFHFIDFRSTGLGWWMLAVACNHRRSRATEDVVLFWKLYAPCHQEEGWESWGQFLCKNRRTNWLYLNTCSQSNLTCPESLMDAGEFLWKKWCTKINPITRAKEECCENVSREKARN